jgi:hypothetical protein
MDREPRLLSIFLTSNFDNIYCLNRIRLILDKYLLTSLFIDSIIAIVP